MNVAVQVYLIMCLEVSVVFGQVMVLDNQDLGFIVVDQNDMLIMFNDFNSVIFFCLDAAAAVNVIFCVWFISIIG